MRLASPESVVASAGIGSNSGSLDNAKRALDAVTPLLEGALESAFSGASVVNYFSPRKDRFVFRLSDIFVDADSVVVRESTSSDTALLEAGEGDLVLPTAYFVDADRGLISFRNQPRVGAHTVSVAYDFGLSKSNDDAETLKAPVWLQEIAIAAAILYMNTVPFNQANRKEKTVTNAARAVTSMVYNLMAPHFRPRMGLEFHVRRVVDE